MRLANHYAAFLSGHQMPAADWLIQTTEIIHKLASSTVKILHTGNKLTDENAPKHLLNCFQSFWNKYLHYLPRTVV